MAYWLDYSAAKLSGTTIAAAGYTGVIRYLDSPANLGRKHTDPNEYRGHVAAGLGVRMVMQTTTSASDGGYGVGQDHARRALAGAEFLGYGGVIYFTNDRTTLPSSQRWDDYLTGAASVLGWDRVGAYGFANAMDVASHMTACQHFWQAGRRSDVRPFVQVWQDNNTQVHVAGVLCDRNLILKPLDVQEDDLLPDERNALLSIHGALFGKHDPATGKTVLTNGNQGDTSLLNRFYEFQTNLRTLVARPGAVVDVPGLAAALAPLLPDVLTELSDEGVARVAAAAADETDRRARGRLAEAA